MSFTRKIPKIILHFAFWISIYLAIAYQNIDAPPIHHLYFLRDLVIWAIAAYINLYLLLPYFFLRKKYLSYTILLIINILAIAFVLTLFRNFTEKSATIVFLANILDTFFAIIIIASLKLLRDNSRKQMQIKTLENAKLTTELSLLKAQINPHFFFNSLNNLYGMVLQNRNKQASNMILKLSNLMRYVLESNTKEVVSLEDEVKFIQNYLALEQIRLSQDFDIHFEISLTHQNTKIPPLLFITLVENVFKHAITQHTEKGFAHFSLSLQDTQLFFEAKNSLPTHQTNTAEKTGTGLQNLRKRLEILYPHKYTLSIEKTEKMYQINLFFEL